MILKRKDKERQKLPINVNVEHHEVVSYFNHFKERYVERIGGELNYAMYWDTWVVFLRGKFVVENDGIMYRMVGSYFNDEKMYKVIYKKIKTLNIYVPLTIYELDEHKKRYRYYMKSINKNYYKKP